MDLGAGDGRAAFRAALKEPATLHIAIDPDARALAEVSRRAGRTQARGGASNFIAVRAAVEGLPPELAGAASRVTVTLPWGSLLRAIALPDVDALRAIRALCRPGAAVEFCFGYDACIDSGTASRLELPPLTPHHIGQLSSSYAEAGLEVLSASRLDAEALRQLGTTWARRLAVRPGREAWRISARAS